VDDVGQGVAATSSTKEHLMDILERQTVQTRLWKPSDVQWCPECGAIMTEADRLVEDRALFVWYTCSRADCDGQWLKKFSKDSVNV